MAYWTRKRTKERLRELAQNNDPEKRRKLENQLWDAGCYILYDESYTPVPAPVEDNTTGEDISADNIGAKDNDRQRSTEEEAGRDHSTAAAGGLLRGRLAEIHAQNAESTHNADNAQNAENGKNA